MDRAPRPQPPDQARGGLSGSTPTPPAIAEEGRGGSAAASPLPRRTLLKATAVGAAASLLPRPAAAADGTQIRLRLLETSDLHMFVDDYDYFRDRPDETVGLAKTAALIDAARAEAPNSLLFDNGDLIQGNPLADYMALEHKLAPGEIHPMFKAMNLLGYDAATVGNHEFNYGLAFLAASLQGPKFPFVCANVIRADSSPFLPPTTVLERTVRDTNGKEQRLRIGVIGLVTPQIMIWDKSALAGKLATLDIVDTARRHVPALRATCDLVVALCHSGIAAGERRGGDENAAYYLAAVPGIDAIFTGHAHRVFPGPDYAGHDGIDAMRGTLAGVPAVMPGFWGSHLGIIDLTLERQDGIWRVADFHTEARPIYRRDGGKVVPLADSEPRIVDAVATEHAATLAYIRQPVGSTAAAIDSYFALVGDDPCTALVNAAQVWYARPLLAATPHAGLPLLSAAAPFKAGGMAGPENYTDIEPGPVALENVADLYMFPNTVRAVRVTGAALAEWLERSAGIFERLDPTAPGPQKLIDPRFPAYNFDVIAGITYRIDVTQPRRYAPDGTLADPAARRITELRHAGKKVDPAGEFVVVTNNYRADGGGRFPGLDGTQTVLEAPDANRDVIARYITTLKTIPAPVPSPWRFAAAKITGSFDSAPAAARHLDAHPNIRAAGAGDSGFARYTIDLA